MGSILRTERYPMAEDTSKSNAFVMLRTRDLCINPAVGKFLENYLLKVTTAEESAKFQKHCQECLHCSVGVRNQRILDEASKYYGLKPGPELDLHLTEVTLAPMNHRRMSAEFAKRYAEK